MESKCKWNRTYIYKDNYEYKEYKAGKKSQAEAHEAIRITHFHRLEELKDILNKEDITNENAIKLYELIFLNTLASQLKAAKIKKTNIKANIRLEEFNTSINHFNIPKNEEKEEGISPFILKQQLTEYVRNEIAYQFYDLTVDNKENIQTKYKQQAIKELNEYNNENEVKVSRKKGKEYGRFN